MILIDTSVWIALIDSQDSCHSRAKDIVKDIFHEDVGIFDHIYGEILTVLRNKTSNEKCLKFVEYLKYTKININFCSKESFFMAQEFFFRFRKISFIDSLLMAFAKEINSDLITFDKELKKAWNQVKGKTYKPLPAEDSN
mgnify:FL=1